MAKESFDCIIIGSGPGGYVAAIRAAQLGMSVAVVEQDKIGGRCLNYACIPAKAVLRSADIVSEIREAGEFGITVAEPTVDFGAVSARREEVIGTLVGGVEMLLKKNKVELITGTATLTGGKSVSVNGRELEAAKAIILAAGSVARAIPGASFGGTVIDTAQAWAFETLPAKLAVVGSGASGCEIASAYARLGAEVELFEALDRVLPAEDKDISR
ncbi:MAG: FAD-dependent oxidoreductase, partial [Solirubrobacterales bacterium]|nr:FAD-dependent oxidoreductase [Solirubrobacterales bacterium]